LKQRMAPGGRPRSRERELLLGSVRALVGGPLGGATVLQMASLAQLQEQRARRVVENMRRAGELQPVGSTRSPLSGRRLVVYAPGGPGAEAARSPLENVLRLWHSPTHR
jgi:hypothetical protein